MQIILIICAVVLVIVFFKKIITLIFSILRIVTFLALLVILFGDVTPSDKIEPSILCLFLIFISSKILNWPQSSDYKIQEKETKPDTQPKPPKRDNSPSQKKPKSPINNIQKFQITVLGGHGVGKTSLLATVYGEFERHLTRGLQLQVNPSYQTRNILNDKLGELESALDSEIVQGINAGEGNKRCYQFNIGLPLQLPAIQLEFNDYPGGWLKDENYSKEVINFLRASTAILWVLDAAALMVRGENEESYSTKINQTLHIKTILNLAFTDLPDNAKKVILLVPIKCETWTTAKKDRLELCVHVENECESVINLLKSADPKGNRFAIAIIPVETLGGVRFDHLQVDANKQPQFIFKRKDEEALYQPRYAEQIFAYGLSFILQRYSEQSNDRKFTEALKKLVERRNTKEAEGFKVLHGKF